MRRQLFLAVACFGLLSAYGYALIWVFGYEAALPMPRQWTRLWMILADTLTLILVSVPVAALVARFGGRHATAVALAMTVVLFAVTVVPTLPEDVGEFARAAHAANMLAMYAFGQIRLIAALPLLVWLFCKLPSNNRWRGP
jgi:heme/copper-type cytochrome/quinol oxidase subunit 3